MHNVQVKGRESFFASELNALLAFLPINTSAITRISKSKIAGGKQFISVTHIKSLVNLLIVSKASLLMTNTMIAMDVEANNVIVVFFMIEMPGLGSSTTGANAIRAIKCAPIIGYGGPFAHIGKFIVVFANTKSSCQIIIAIIKNIELMTIKMLSLFTLIAPFFN